MQVREQKAGGSTAGASPAQSWVRAAGVWGVVQAEKKKKKEGEGMTKRHTHARISLAGSRRNVAVVVKRKRV